MEDGTVWDNYPPEVLDQALEENERQVARLAQRPVCQTDPYNVSFRTLVRRWLQRQHESILGHDGDDD